VLCPAKFTIIQTDIKTLRASWLPIIAVRWTTFSELQGILKMGFSQAGRLENYRDHS
jgi:hypothetical protein